MTTLASSPPVAPSDHLTPPRPLCPLSGAVVDGSAVSFQWQSLPDTRSYRLQIAPDRLFARGVIELEAGPSTDFTLVGSLPASDAPFFWRVRAEFEAGTSRWSPYGRFFTGSDDAADAYRAQQEASRIEARKVYLRQRREAAAARDLIPFYERDDVIPSDLESGFTGIAMLLSFVLTVLIILYATMA